jgi:multidrug resistance efflux pump
MAMGFEHTLRSLERGRPRWQLCAGLLLALGLWSAWLLFAEVDVRASAPHARIEVFRMAHRAAAQESGRLVGLYTDLGRWVHEGELLAQLDDTLERAQVAEKQVSLEGLALRLGAVRAQLTAERERRDSQLRLSRITQARAGLALEQAELAANYKQELARAAQSLHEQFASSRLELASASTAFASSQVQVRDATADVERMHAASDVDDKTQLARLAELQRQLTELEAEHAAARAALATLQTKLERRKVLAPASGRLGNIAARQVGDVVQSAEALATIIPPDDVRVVASFEPDAAIGRILPGQAARVRLDGFSWVEYGTLSASVTHVASEPQDGLVRVELAVVGQLPRVALQHGLQASVDVRLEQATPWAIVQRSIGSWVLPPSAARSETVHAKAVVP